MAETFKFNQLRQRSGDPFNEYLTRVRAQVVKCNYRCTCGASTEQRAIRDQVVTGVAQEEPQKKLLGKKSATTEDIIRIAKAFEDTKEDSALLRQKNAAAVIQSVEEEEEQIAAVVKSCFKCHQPWTVGHRCAAKACFKCGKPGHFKRQCQLREIKDPQRQQQQQQRVNSIQKGAFKVQTVNICRVGDSKNLGRR